MNCFLGASHAEESSKYMAVLQWLEGYPEKSGFAFALLKNIQLNNVDPRLIQLIDGNPQVADVFEVKQMLLSAYKYNIYF